MTKVLKQLARNDYFWLVLILGLGFSLRLYGLADVAVSNDEGIVYSRWISVSFREIMIDDLILNSHAFAYILDRLSILIMGDRLFALRWPSLCISVLGIALIYRFAREILGKHVGLLSALLLAISPYSIFFAHRLRGYSGVVTFCLLAYTLALLALQTNKRRYWLGLGLASIVMMYTHLFTAIAFLNLMLFIGLMWGYGYRLGGLRRPSFTRLIVSMAITIIILAGLYAPIWVKVLQTPAPDSAPVSGEETPVDIISMTRPQIPASVWTNLFWFSGFVDKKDFAGQPGWPGVYIFLGLIVVGIAIGFIRGAGIKVLVLLGWAWLPFIEIWLAQQIFSEFWARPKFLGYALLPLLILAALALVELPRCWPFKKLPPLIVTLLPLILLAVFWFSAMWEIYRVNTNGNWQSIGNFLQEHSTPNDLVVCHRFDDLWRSVDIDGEDFCTRTLSYRGEADVNMAGSVMTSHGLVYGVLPQANSGLVNRLGRVWFVVWNVPVSAEIPASEGLVLTEFNKSGRSFVLLTDQQQTYVSNLRQALTTLCTAAQSQNQRFLFNLMVAILASADGHNDLAEEALDLAFQYQPDHPDGVTKLERTKGVVETLFRPSIDNPLEVNFDDKIILRGYNINTTEITPGSKLNLTFFWQAVNNVQEDYNVFLHLRDETGHMVAQFDYQPFYGSYPTRHWQPGQALTDVQELPIPADLNLLPGKYNLVIGFYNPNTLARLPLSNDQSGENAFYLTSLTVQ